MLREWCSVAYQRELNSELAKLYDQFRKWDAGVLSPFELTDAIHNFHKGPARELYVRYGMSGGKGDCLVARAIARGFITKEEIPDELVKAVRSASSLFEEL